MLKHVGSCIVIDLSMADVTDILVDSLREALKSSELSTTLAFLAVTFLFVHGFQGEYHRDLQYYIAQKQQTQANAAGRSGAPTPIKSSDTPTDVSIPALGFSSRLVTAAFISLILYWVFTLRAAIRLAQARAIAMKLADLDPL